MADLFFDQSTFFSKSVFFNTQSGDSTELPTHRYGYHWDRLEANPHINHQSPPLNRYGDRRPGHKSRLF